MFESIAVSVLNSVLGKYIKDLDSSQLRLGILKGKQTLDVTTSTLVNTEIRRVQLNLAVTRKEQDTSLVLSSWFILFWKNMRWYFITL